MTPARRAALLRLLKDWDAGRCTAFPDDATGEFASMVMDQLYGEGLTAFNCMPGNPRDHYTLTPAGLAAARREKDATTKDTPDA